MLFHTKSGHHIYYEVHGKGKAMVCFHGNGQSVSYFKPQLPLAAAFQLILIDTPGHGQSSLLKEKLTFAAIATEVKELLDSLDMEDYVLVGHSDGANLAIAFENVYPKKVSGMLLNAGNISFMGLKAHSVFSISLKVLKLALHSVFNPKLKNAYHVAGLMMANQTIIPSSYSNQIPVYVLVGEKDLIRANHSLAIAKHYDKGRLITLPYMGHNVNKKPEVFNDVITQLMQVVVGENIKK
ncbi:Ndr domain protein [Streptococcus uberis S6261]|uniref:alpha/beta fold hydrolase n=1 Tax=Streptococcus uberis TaxID=1349 RepID=UPI000620402E|nr:alpha/beta hydrolase [Streptococcus uberis]KKF49635.1 Ndr domain protein [Streptococcus uberis C5072]KKF51167.1 Ndr domain protein [Streptococcus uberis S6261]